MNDLAFHVNHMRLDRFHMSQYTWLNLYQRYVTSDVCIWCLRERCCLLAYPPCPYTNWKRMILPSDQLLPTVCYMWCIYWVFVSLTSPVSSFIDVLLYCTCPYTHWKRMILPIDQRLSTLWYIRWTYLMFIQMISTILSIINVLSYYISLYTLKTNDLTRWSTFINCMLY